MEHLVVADFYNNIFLSKLKILVDYNQENGTLQKLC